MRVFSCYFDYTQTNDELSFRFLFRVRVRKSMFRFELNVECLDRQGSSQMPMIMGDRLKRMISEPYKVNPGTCRPIAFPNLDNQGDLDY